MRTRTGRYHLDFDAGMLTREPVPGDPLYPTDDLRKDNEPIPFQLIGNVVIGHPARFLLQIRDDGVPTVRTTTPVMMFERA